MICLGGYFSVLLLPYSISRSAIESPDLLPLYSTIHHTNNPYIYSFQPYPLINHYQRRCLS